MTRKSGSHAGEFAVENFVGRIKGILGESGLLPGMAPRSGPYMVLLMISSAIVPTWLAYRISFKLSTNVRAKTSSKAPAQPGSGLTPSS